MANADPVDQMLYTPAEAALALGVSGSTSVGALYQPTSVAGPARSKV
jgi:hypothetical protein